MRLIRYRIVVVAALAACLALVGGGEASTSASGSGRRPRPAQAALLRASSESRLRQQSTTLRAGGNAVDAAIAAGGVLGVTEPFSAGIGGGGFMVIYRSSDGKVTTIDSRETAPAAMTPTSFMESGAPLPFNDARYSGLSVGVRAPSRAGRRRSSAGTMSLAQARPGIHVARHGFVIDQTFFDQTAQNRDFFDDVRRARRSPRSGWDPGATSARCSPTPTLRGRTSGSHTSEQRGFTRAPSPTRWSRRYAVPDAATANHVWRRGVMTMRDLHTYVAPERAPTHVTYRGNDIYSMGPPSSGGSTVGEALNILEGYDLSAMPVQTLCTTSWRHRGTRSPIATRTRRSSVLRRAARRSPVEAVRGDTTRRADHGTAATSPVAPGDPRPFNAGSASLTAFSSPRRPPT